MLQEPDMIERQWTDEIRMSCERNDADAIVRTSFNEFARDLFYRIKPARAIMADGEVLEQHGGRDIEQQHDVNSARLDVAGCFSKLRPRERNGESSKREKNEAGQKTACFGLDATSHRAQQGRGG